MAVAWQPGLLPCVVLSPMHRCEQGDRKGSSVHYKSYYRPLRSCTHEWTFCFASKGTTPVSHQGTFKIKLLSVKPFVCCPASLPAGDIRWPLQLALFLSCQQGSRILQNTVPLGHVQRRETCYTVGFKGATKPVQAGRHLCLGCSFHPPLLIPPQMAAQPTCSAYWRLCEATTHSEAAPARHLSRCWARRRPQHLGQIQKSSL